MNLQSLLFQGMTPKSCRGLIAEKILALKPSKFFFPCAGRFTVPETIIKMGAKPEDVICSDISLYSSVIGYLSDLRHDYDELGVVLPEEETPFPETEPDPVSQAARLLMHLCYSQYPPRSKFCCNMRKELRQNFKIYHKQLLDDLQQMTNNLAGLRYDMADLYTTIDEAEQTENSVLYVSVPSGPEKTHENANVLWNAPEVGALTVESITPLLERLTNSSVPSFVFLHRELTKMEKLALDEPVRLDFIPEGWHAFYAKNGGDERVDFVIANREMTGPHVIQKKPGVKIKKYQIFNDEEIREDSKVEFLEVNKDTALYYRDLFVHKLGTTQGRIYFLAFIDGRVFAATGWHPGSLFLGKMDGIYETFAIGISSARYKRLGKLLQLLLTSGEMRAIFEKNPKCSNQRMLQINGILTSAIATGHEGKANRSALKIVRREPLPGGKWKVHYEARFRPDTFADVLKKWIAKWGNIARPGEEKNAESGEGNNPVGEDSQRADTEISAT